MTARARRAPARPAGRPSLLDQYRRMCVIRRFEDRAKELFEQGVIVGTEIG